MITESDKILKEYADFKKTSVTSLREIWSLSHRVGDPRGLGKEDLISDILHGRHGSKRMTDAFNL